MGLLSLNLPVIGQSSATEDQKVRDALAAIQTDYNGNLTDANIAPTAGIQQSKLANGSTGLGIGSFSAYRAAALSITTGTDVIFDTEEFDVSGWHDVATGRFTPQVAGWYQLSFYVQAGGPLTLNNFWRAVLRKNGVDFKATPAVWQVTTAALCQSGGTMEVQANGTTDFFSVNLTHNQGVAAAVGASAVATFFQGELIGRS